MKTALDLLHEHITQGGSLVIVPQHKLFPEHVWLREMGYIKFSDARPAQKREGGRAHWRRQARRKGSINTYIATPAGRERLLREGYKFT